MQHPEAILPPFAADDALHNNGFIRQLAVVAKNTAFLCGLLRPTIEDPNNTESTSYAPFTLFPSPVPRKLFTEAFEVQQDFNMLVDRVSQDSEFLTKALASTVQVDEFTAGLFSIYKQVLEEGITQTITLGINRSDYMFQKGQDHSTSLKQIEINTVAAGLAGLAERVPDVHRHVLNFWGKSDEAAKILTNNAAKGIAEGIAKAWQLYGSPEAAVLFLVEKDARNIFDQRCLEMELWGKNIRVIRRLFLDIHERGVLDDEKILFVDGYEIAVVYFRTGFDPMDYHNDDCWVARLLIERSKAIKCPDIATHLVGTKKIQQELARSGMVEKFLTDCPKSAERIRATFVGLYSIDEGPEGDEIIKKAVEDPEAFVLKPQREGGGNNIFGEELKQLLGNIKDGPKRSAYILMDKIKPQTVKNYLLRPGSAFKLSECVVELGVFGVYIRKCQKLVMNESSGYLLRTKSTESAGGGVSVGVSVLDTPYLI
ncbi:glutathione synthetase-like [Scyliorhinus canicula]|uniref:glutathione synthetase-like n=1 Tax=Scyliorhinus canicula TaxID=7830 RepID=UPI0018F52290|nr:glutathione synthetase-like [Scyliorhinus canicula]